MKIATSRKMRNVRIKKIVKIISCWRVSLPSSIPKIDRLGIVMFLSRNPSAFSFAVVPMSPSFVLDILSFMAEALSVSVSFSAAMANVPISRSARNNITSFFMCWLVDGCL